MFILNRILTSNIPVAIKKKMHITFLINPGLQSHKLHKYILFYHYQIKLFLSLIWQPKANFGPPTSRQSYSPNVSHSNFILF